MKCQLSYLPCPGVHLAMSQDLFDCNNWQGVGNGQVLLFPTKNYQTQNVNNVALAGVAQWVELRSANQRVSG